MVAIRLAESGLFVLDPDFLFQIVTSPGHWHVCIVLFSDSQLLSFGLSHVLVCLRFGPFWVKVRRFQSFGLS